MNPWYDRHVLKDIPDTAYRILYSFVLDLFNRPP